MILCVLRKVVKGQAVKLEQFFQQRPVFTTKELAEFLGSSRRASSRTQESLLDYHTRKGRLLRVRRGLYAVVPRGTEPATCPVDPFLLAAKMTDDATLAHHAALEFHGVAYSVHKSFAYLTKQRARPTTFRGARFRPVQHPKTLTDAGKEGFGVEIGRASCRERV